MTDDNPPLEPPAIPVSTTFDVNGATGTLIGPAFGVIVRSPGIGRNLMGSIKSLRRGDITEFSGTLEEARQHAVARMVEHAQEMGANAVIGMRFDSSDLNGEGLVEVLAYGSAVKI